jgi:hypothetical protein
VTSLEPGTASAPEEERTIDAQPPRKGPDRRTVQLAVLAEMDIQPDPPPVPIRIIIPEPRSPRGRFSMPTSRDDWLRLAEWAVGDWAATLRNALLLLLVFAAMITLIGIAVGVESAAAATVVGLIVFLAGRRRDGSVSG